MWLRSRAAILSPEMVVRSPGTYALVIACDCNERVRIGRLGEMQLSPGFYVYVGSAFGPGGLRARIGHHLRPAEPPHWHIDYLFVRAAVRTIWFRHGGRSLEHEWARRIGAIRTATPIPRFGSSDCTCETHLFYFRECPSASMKRALAQNSSRKAKTGKVLN